MKTVKRFLPVALVPGAWILMLGSLGVLVYCGFRMVQFDLPMMRGDYELATRNQVMVDSPEAQYNYALSCYRDHDYDTCRKVMTQVYAGCVDRSGAVRESQRELAARAQFYIGNSQFNLGKNDDAVAAYEQSLRLVPGDLYTIYNLEKLQDSQKSGGEGGSGKSEKSGAPKKKI